MAVGTCNTCGKEKELGNRTTCEACRKKAQRAKKADPTPVSAGEGTPAPEIGTPPENPDGVIYNIPKSLDKLTATDLDYQEENDAFFQQGGHPAQPMVFGPLRKGVACRTCNKRFDTHLDLARFCSTSCKNELLDHLAGQRK